MNKFKNRFLVSVSVLALSASVAFASDLPSKQISPSVAIPKTAKMSWTGLYVGVGGGVSRFDTALTEKNLSSFYDISESPSITSPFVTLNLGLDYQINDNIVLGFVGDFDFRNQEKRSYSNPLVTIDTSIANNWSAGARIGMLISPSSLVYISGGYSSADISVSGTGVNSVSEHKWSPGYFGGVGLETMINDNLSAKLEYRYAHYTGLSASGDTCGKEGKGCIESVSADDINMNSIKLSLNWRF